MKLQEAEPLNPSGTQSDPDSAGAAHLMNSCVIDRCQAGVIDRCQAGVIDRCQAGAGVIDRCDELSLVMETVT